MTREDLLPVFFGLFCASVVMTNAVSGNVIIVGPFVFVAGTLLYPVTFLLTDIMSEVFGARVASRAVWTGFVAQAIAVVFVQCVSVFPSIDPELGASWNAVFIPTARIAVASMAAYLVAQLVDVRVFHRVKAATGGDHLWLRNNVSTIVSQGIDTVIFVMVAFWGVLPLDVLGAMILGQYIVKALLALADTPFCYLAVHLVRLFPRGARVDA